MSNHVDSASDEADLDAAADAAWGDRRWDPEPVASAPARSDAAPWPSALEDAALHGVAGRFVRAVEPHTEVDRPSLLIHFLVGSGCLLGARVRAIAADAEHPPRLFAVCVGETSKARKGTAYRHTERVLRAVEPAFAERCVEA